MPNRRAKTQGDLVDLLHSLKTARLFNGILVSLINQALELQYMTGLAHRRSFRVDLQTKLDKAAKIARVGSSDIAIEDIAAAKKRLKALDAAVQTVRDSLVDEMLLTVRSKKEDINKVGAAIGPLAAAGFLLPFDDGEYFHLPPVRGAVEVWCKIALGPYAKEGFIQAGFEVTTSTGPVDYPIDLKPVPLDVKHALPDSDDNYEFGADTGGRVAAPALCGAGVTQLNPNGDGYSGDTGNTMQVVSDPRYFEALTRGFWAAKSKGAPASAPGFTVTKV
jgi:hypothetical protein